VPADIATTNGRPAIMYAGPTPWHRLGTRLDKPATAAEAITAAGLDYTVDLQPLRTISDLHVPRRKAVVRSDTRQVLGVVSKGYTPIQNRECFNFMDQLAACDEVAYHTAGALGKGERVWLLAKLPNSIRVRGSDDQIDPFLLLSNSHDGSSALRCFFTSIRVCCANTWNLAHRQHRGEGIAIRHRGNLTSRVNEARQVLGLARRQFEQLAEKVDFLAGHAPNQTRLNEYFGALFPDPDGRHPARAQNVRMTLNRLFEDGMGADIPQTRHMAFAAFNAITEYIDHHKTTRGRDEADRTSKRIESSLFGAGADLKVRAFDLALRLAAGDPLVTLVA